MTGGPITPQARRELPRSDDVRHPTRWPLHSWRPGARWLIRRRYDVRLHGTEHVPTHGGVILASNHVGLLDGPLLAIFSPRPVHALTKHEMFRGPMGRFLLFAGQIPLLRVGTDPAAVKNGLHVLRRGGVVGIYPEGARCDGELRTFKRGAAYFALVTGAPVVPVVMFGTREPGAGISSLPAAGTRVDVVYGEPFRVDPVPWPRMREQVGQTAELLQKHMQIHLDRAKALTGRTLPGPPPLEEHE